MRRRMLASLGGWTNPYITDGLVAMWDGEWNAGGGKHTDTMTEWLPCVGNSKYVMGSASGTVKVFGKYIETNMTGTSGNLLVASPSIPRSSIGWTVEHICRIVSISRGVTIAGGFFGGGGLYLSNYQTYWMSDYGSMEFSWSISTNTAHNYAFTASNDKLNGYNDGVFLGTKQYTMRSGADSVFLQGGTNRGVMRSYCLRIYDRALTDAEIAANWEIDKARFELE